MPDAVLKFYSKFPLVLLPAESISVQHELKQPVLWVKPAHSDDAYGWESSDPTCLRVQLLFLLRNVPVEFKPWSNAESAPEGTLPALHLPGGELLSSGEIRPWLEKEYPLQEDVKALNGMPTQEAHTTALAHSHLILSKIYPVYSTLEPHPSTLCLPFPLPTTPINLSPSIYHRIPLWLRNLGGAETRLSEDSEQKEKEGIEGIEALTRLSREYLRDGEWFLGAREPSPLDALIASHIYPLATLPETLKLRQAVDQAPELKEYVERVMQRAGRGYRGHVRV